MTRPVTYALDQALEDLKGAYVNYDPLSIGSMSNLVACVRVVIDMNEEAKQQPKESVIG